LLALGHLNALNGYDQISQLNTSKIRQIKRHGDTLFPRWKQGLQHSSCNRARILAVSSKDRWCLGVAILLGLRRSRAVYQAFRKRGDVGRHLAIMVRG